MAKSRLFPPNYKALNDAGEIMTTGATLEAYLSNTSTPQDIYSDSTGGTVLDNPYTIPSDGLIDVWVDDGVAYRIIIKDPDGTVLHDKSGIFGVSSVLSITTLGDITTGNITADAITGDSLTVTGDITSGGEIEGLSAVITNGITAKTLALTTEDSRTNTVIYPSTITATTSGTPANGIGVGTKYIAESADETTSDFGTVEFSATDVTAASEDTQLVIKTRTAGAALAPAYKFRVAGVGDYIFTGSPTAERTITLPDGDLNLTSSLTSVMSLAASTTVSVAVGSVNFTDLDLANFKYILELDNVSPSVNGDALYLRFSTNNGSSYDSGAGAYSYAIQTASAAGTSDTGVNSSTFILCAGSVGSTAGRGIAGRIEIRNPMNTSSRTSSISDLTYITNAGDTQAYRSMGRYATTGATNAFRVVFSTGNVAAGSEFRLYAVSAT